MLDDLDVEENEEGRDEDEEEGDGLEGRDAGGTEEKAGLRGEERKEDVEAVRTVVELHEGPAGGRSR